LAKRGRKGCKGRDESRFIDVLDEIADSGRTPADDLLLLYHGRWRGDIDRVFREFAY
jgi:glutamate--cysteine ligase